MELAAIVVAVLAVYWPVRHGAFVFDDLTSVVKQRKIQERQWRGYLNWKRPLTFLSYTLTAMLCSRRNPLPPFPFHLTNMGLHVFSGFTVMWIADMCGIAPLWAGILFSVHPLAVNAVANVAGRASLLAGLFVLMSLGLLLAGHAVIAVIPFLCALASKEDHVAHVLSLAGVSLWRHDPYWWAIPTVAAMLGIWKWRELKGIIRNNGDSAAKMAGAQGALPFLQHVSTALTATVYLFPQWAAGLNHTADRQMAAIPWLSWKPMVAIGGVVSGAALIPWFPFPVQVAAVWILLSPITLHIVIPTPDIAMEQRAYGTIAGIVLILAWAIPAQALLVLVVWFATSATGHARRWIGPIPLWSWVIESGPTERAYINLGFALEESGRLAEAEQSYRAALQGNPRSGQAWTNLGSVYLGMNREADAIGCLEESIKLCPQYPYAYESFARWHFHRKEWAPSIRYFVQALARLPRRHRCWNKLGLAYMHIGQIREAMDSFNQAIRYDPGEPIYRANARAADRALGSTPSVTVPDVSLVSI